MITTTLFRATPTWLAAILLSISAALLTPTTALASESQLSVPPRSQISQCQYLIARGVRNSGDCSHYVTQQPSDKDMRDCIEQGGVWGGLNAKSGIRSAAANATAGCVGAVLSNHSH